MGLDLGATSSLVDLEAVDSAAKAKHWTLAFPPAVEQRFKVDIGTVRARRLAEGIPRTIAIYNGFLILDALLVPDVLPLALALHLGVVTPMLLVAMAALRRWPTAALREASAALVMTAMVAQVVICGLVTTNPNANHYQYLVVIGVLYFNAILRPAFPMAIATTGFLIAAHILALLVNPVMTWPAIGTVTIMLVGGAYITLLSTYQAERQTRRTYLRRLRDEIAAAQLSRDNVALARMARVDPLTDLENRRGLEAHVEQLLSSPAWRDGLFALLVIDIDHFKAFNDRHGHAEGDRCLRAVAKAVSAELSSLEAPIGRVGGEEFIVLLPGADLERGRRIAERLRETVERLAICHGGTGSGVVTVSIGVAEGRLTGPGAIAATFDQADAALYAAKRRGRNRVHSGAVPPEAGGRARSAA